MDYDVDAIQKTIVSLLSEITEKNYELSLSVGKLRRYLLLLGADAANLDADTGSSQDNNTGFKPNEHPLIIERSYGAGSLKEQATVASGLSNKALNNNGPTKDKE